MTARRSARMSIAAGLAAVVLSPGLALAADNYPSRPITLVIGFPPGGGADHVGRVYANALSRELGQTVMVENRPGAGSTIGATIAARAKPDGHTLYLGNSSVMGSDMVLYQVDYTPDDFVPVARLTTAPMVLIANAALGIKDVKGLIARARDEPGGLNVASSGNGVITHLSAVEFMQLADVQLMHIPFKGGAPAVQSVASGDTDISFATAPSAKSIIDSGKAVGLAVTSATRSKLIDYPPIAEALPGYDVSNWWGIFTPKGTPQPVVEQLFAATNRLLADPAVRTSLEAGYEEPMPATSVAEFTAFAKEEGHKGRRLAEAGAKSAN